MPSVVKLLKKTRFLYGSNGTQSTSNSDDDMLEEQVDQETMDEMEANESDGLMDHHAPKKTGTKCSHDNPKHLWLKPVADFLCSSTSTPQLVMWGFLAWFLLVVSITRPLPTKPFVDACLIMTLIGLVLNANAFVSFKISTMACPNTKEEPTLMDYVSQQYFSIIRLFMIPYCVSCYSGIVNSASGFVSIFPVEPHVAIPVVSGAFLFPILLNWISGIINGIVYPKETKAHRLARQESGYMLGMPM